jgi:hypothetical protein
LPNIPNLIADCLVLLKKTDSSMTPLHQEIIVAYRHFIEVRYDYAQLKKRSDFPASFDEVRVNKFKSYFLDYLYPAPKKRKELNAAFEGLDEYIKHPSKLLRLLMDSSSLLFKYGKHLPQILKTAINALQSFRKANAFEGKLIFQAELRRKSEPNASVDVNYLISHLSPDEIEDFIQSGQNLFQTLKNRPLVAKVKDILARLIEKMRKRPTVYTEQDIQALLMGEEIISIGDSLFAELSLEEQEKIFVFIIAMEREELARIFASR